MKNCLLLLFIATLAFPKSFVDNHENGINNIGSPDTSITWTSHGSRGWEEVNGAISGTDGTFEGQMICNSNIGSNGSLTVNIDNNNEWDASKMSRVLFRWNSPTNFYSVYVSRGQGGYKQGKLFFTKDSLNVNSPLEIANSFDVPAVYDLKIKMNGSLFSFYIDSTLIATHVDSTYDTGAIGYGIPQDYYYSYGKFTEVKWDEDTEEDLTGWRFSKEIQINTTQSGADIHNIVENFPFLFKLTPENFDFSGINEDGSDIRFMTKDGKILPYEIEYLNKEEKLAAIWVSVPKITANSIANSIILKWGTWSPAITDNSVAVWVNSNIIAHCNDKFKNSGHKVFDYVDSTLTAKTGNIAGAVQVTQGIDLSDGIKHYDFEKGTVSCWVKPNNSTQNQTLFELRRNDNVSNSLKLDLTTDDKVNFTYKLWGNPFSVSHSIAEYDTNWVHIAVSYCETSIILYVNGIEVDNVTKSGVIQSSPINRFYVGNSVDGNTLFKGVIDEFRFWYENKSASWIKLSYENQKSNSNILIDPYLNIYPIQDKELNNLSEKSNDDTIISFSNTNDLTDTNSYGLIQINLTNAINNLNSGYSIKDCYLKLSPSYVDTNSEFNISLFEVDDEDLDFDESNFTMKNSSTYWKHVEKENDASLSSEGIGTEDLIGDGALLNWYEGSYKLRRSLDNIEIKHSALNNLEGYGSDNLYFTSPSIASAILNSITRGDTLITFLVVSNGIGKGSFYSSDISTDSLKPALNIQFHESKQLFSWNGKTQFASFPKDLELEFESSILNWFGRFGKSIIFEAGQKATVSDASIIDYSKGNISFWYQKGYNPAPNASFFERSDEKFSFFRSPDNDTLVLNIGNSNNTCKWPISQTSILPTGDTITNILVKVFDGKQHYIELAWNVAESFYELNIDGITLPLSEKATSTEVLDWTTSSLVIGENTLGMIEKFEIYSGVEKPLNAEISDENSLTASYLPLLPISFNNKLDMLIVSPSDQDYVRELHKLASRNTAIGVKSYVITLDEIEKQCSGGDVQEKIRVFIKRAFEGWGISYVMLGGSNEKLPSRKVHFKNKHDNYVLTDKYYSNLDGNWNADGDEYFAESNDEFDVTSEVVVSRIPADNWIELRSSIEKSSIAMGLPPYGGQGVTNSGTILISANKMVLDVDSISDGKYFAEELKRILNNGIYTKGIPVNTYYPEDITFDSATQYNVQGRLKKFTDNFKTAPATWIHFGHGNPSTIVVDQFQKKNSLGTEWVGLNADDLDKIEGFNSREAMSTMKVVGCETNSLEQFSMGKKSIINNFGGAVTYTGTSEYSYPNIEAELLIEEMKLIADSSVFLWGEVFAQATNTVLQKRNTTPNGKWVALTRNFYGDPLAPVRMTGYTRSSTLSVTVTEEGDNVTTVAVKDGAGNPVELATVTIISNDGVAKDNSVYATVKTNRFGEAVLPYGTVENKETVITAVHNNYVASRIVHRLGMAPGYSTFVVDASSEYNDYIPVGSDTVSFWVRCFNGRFNPMSNVIVQAPQTTEPGVTITPIGGSQRTISSIGQHATDSVQFNLVVNGDITGHKFVDFNYTVNGVSYVKTLPVFGAQITPVINYLTDANGFLLPTHGDSITMGIVLANQYPVDVENFHCKLECDESYVEIVNGEFTKSSLAALNANYDESITYKISGGYSPYNDGLLNARLIFSADNIKTDTFHIDLNPLRKGDVSIKENTVAIDYKGHVSFQWDGIEDLNDNDRVSDFRGYVIMRKPEGTTDYEVLTLSPVSSSNYYKDLSSDTLPYDTVQYFVVGIDSSFNYSFEDSVTVVKGWEKKLKKGFPIHIGDFNLSTPVVTDWNKNGESEVYYIGPHSVSDQHNGFPLGFRPDGQEVLSNGKNDGRLGDFTASTISFADFNGDGFDDAVITSGNYIIIYDMKNKTEINVVSLTKGENDTLHTGGLDWYSAPVIADYDKDGKWEIFAFGFDNESDGFGTLYHIDETGVRAKKNFDDYGYQQNIVIGDFKTSTNEDELVLAVGFDIFVLDINETDFTVIDQSRALCTRTDDVKESFKSPISVGNLNYNLTGRDLAVIVGDSKKRNDMNLRVINISHEGNISSTIASTPLSFSYKATWACTPVLVDLNGNGSDDIIVAGDNDIYHLELSSCSTIDTLKRFSFGATKVNRISSFDHTSQPYVVDLDSDGEFEIIVSHLGDGNIHAFEKDGTPIAGYPLQVKGKVDGRGIAVDDIEGDGVLDLLVTDKLGNLYAWNLASGSVKEQAWPKKYCNNFKNSNKHYKVLSTNGYVRENWEDNTSKPYAWEGDFSSFSWTNNRLSANYGGKLTLTGPTTSTMKAYEVSGTYRIANANAVFSINAYVNDSSSYKLKREANGELVLYYNASALGTLGTSGTNSKPMEVDTSYSFRISILADGLIRVWNWKTDDTVPADNLPGLVTFNTGLTEGSIAIESDNGNVSFGPLNVISSDASSEANANIAFYDWTSEDTITVKPYLPMGITVDDDNTGFAMQGDTAGWQLKDGALTYVGNELKDKASKVLLTPPTNLSWDNYTFSGTITKPVGDEYDSVGISLVFYDNGTDCYKLSVRGEGNGGNQFLLERNDEVLDTLVYDAFEGNIDIVEFKISILNEGVNQNAITITLNGQKLNPFHSTPEQFIDAGKAGIVQLKSSELTYKNLSIRKE